VTLESAFIRVQARDLLVERRDLFGRRRIHLGDDDDVGHPKVRLAGVIPRLVARSQRVHEHDVHGRPVERQVVVPAVPQKDVALGLGLLEDGPVVDARVDHGSGRDVRLVLLALLDGRVVAIEVRHLGVALHALGGQVPVRHRMPDGHDAPPGVLDGLRDRPGRLGLPDARAHGRHGHDGNGRVEHRRIRSQQHEVGARRQRPAGRVHHVLVRDVGVCEDDVGDVQPANELGHLGLEVDRDPVRVTRSRKHGRVDAVVDERNLRRREPHDLGAGIVAIDHVEVVEVATRGSHDEDAAL
jgi:hypothetical protein